jgi:hypothetical protein
MTNPAFRRRVNIEAGKGRLVILGEHRSQPAGK